MAQPKIRSPLGGGKPGGNGNRDGAPGAEPLWSGEWKVGRRSLQDRFLPKRTVLGHKLHFSRKPHKGKTRASAEGILPAACRVCSRLVVSGLLPQ